MSETERERLGRVAYEAFWAGSTDVPATPMPKEAWCDAAAAVQAAVLDQEHERTARMMQASAEWEKR